MSRDAASSIRCRCASCGLHKSRGGSSWQACEPRLQRQALLQQRLLEGLHQQPTARMQGSWAMLWYCKGSSKARQLSAGVAVKVRRSGQPGRGDGRGG